MEQFDAAIIGAGPAGSSTAISLARRGYRVALVDKEPFPREKLCGDFLSPANWPILRRLGVDREILACEHRTVSRFRVTAPTGAEAEVTLTSKNSALPGLGVRRSSLDQILLLKASEMGVAVWQGARVSALKQNREAWRLDVAAADGAESLCARVLIGADGRHSWVAHRLEMASSAEDHGRAIGFQLHLKGSNLVNRCVEIHLFPGGYAGLIGLDADTINLCLAVDKAQFQRDGSVEALINDRLCLNPHLRDIWRHTTFTGELRSTYPVYFPPRRPYGERILLVGDAARVHEPVTGEGIYFALKGGELAAETVDQAFHAGDFSRARLRSYATRCRAHFSLRWGLNTILRRLLYRPVLLAPFIHFSSKRKLPLESIVRTICRPEVAR